MTAAEPPTVESGTPETLTPTTAIKAGFWGQVTHYGASFEGQQMGCPGSAVYHTWDTSIAAVAWPSRDHDWPCGTRFRVTGPAGVVEVTRQDSCPGCHGAQLDLSEAGMIAACGYLGRCDVWIEVME